MNIYPNYNVGNPLYTTKISPLFSTLNLIGLKELSCKHNPCA